MSPLLRYLLLAATPTAAFVLAEKAVRAMSRYDAHGPLAPLPTRAELSARIERLQAQYDDLRARQPAAKAHRLEATALALADAKDDLFRHDVRASLCTDPAESLVR